MLRKSVVDMPTRFGGFRLYLYEDRKVPSQHHLALVKGDVGDGTPILVRMHSECLTGDVFGSLRCDCGSQLSRALECIQEEQKGVLLYLRQEGRGIGLPAKMQAYALQEKGMDTVQANEHLGFKADLRDYACGAQMLLDLGVREVRLMTNNPKKIEGLSAQGIKVIERVPFWIQKNKENAKYLQTKHEKMGHL